MARAPANVEASGFVRQVGERITAYQGLNGQYRLSSVTCNSRAVYEKQGNADVVMWCTNIRGAMSWCIGPRHKDIAKNAKIWAMTTSDAEHPAEVSGATWVVFCYEQKKWMEQTLARVSVPGDACCVICMEAPRTHIVIPCGHVCFCKECARAAALQVRECPLCRGDLQKIYHVFA